MKGKRVLSLLLCLAVLLGLAVPALGMEKEVFLIRTAEDLVELSRLCTLDSWSQGRIVRLEADVDLGGSGFSPIPTFGGAFQGGGHTITGLRLTGYGSRQGLFRTVQEGGLIRDLNVKGLVAPGGSREQVGGIAGVNQGTIQNCAFTGAVQGLSSVGGIVGLNKTTGEIISCQMNGSVQGEQTVGGICGRSMGLLIRCENRAEVNVRQAQTEAGSLPDLDLSGALEQFTGGGGENSALRDAGHSDVGGVVGWSSGAVQECRNAGPVGYPHVGYNVGGIAGRQTGFLSDCENTGRVLGRKDVGGIVGQAEPEISVSVDSESLELLRQELDRLSGMIHNTLNDMDSQTGTISARLTAIGSGVNSAREHSNTLVDQIGDMVDGNVQSVNKVSESVNLLVTEVNQAVGRLETLMPGLEAAADAIVLFGEHLSGGMEELAAATDSGSALLEELTPALDDLKNAAGDIKDASGKIDTAIAHLREVVVVRDEDVVNKAVLDLGSGLYSLGNGMRKTAEALKKLGNALNYVDFVFTGDLNGDIQRFLTSLGPLSDALTALSKAVDDLGTSTSIIGMAIWDIHDETTFHSDEFYAALDAIQGAVTACGNASGELGDAIAVVQEAVPTAEEGMGHLSAALGQLGEAGDDLSAAAQSLSGVFQGASDVLQPLSDREKITFVPLGEEARATTEALFGALGTVSEELAGLNSDVTAAESALTADLGAITDQFNRVFGLLLDVLYDVSSGSASDVLDQFHDVSDQELNAIRQGKTAGCVNRGSVEGDRDVGGIVGSMAIEYDLDPEDDILSKRTSLRATYETRSVIQSCVNYGSVTAKKDCVGGVAGRMDLGTVYLCESYCAVTSTGGSYVGGVAGNARSSLRDCAARTRLLGLDYVGGVAGSCVTMRNCRAVTTIVEGREYLGALAGYGDWTTGKIEGNLFLDNGLAGLDSVSYAGIAEPVSYEALSALEDVPGALLTFTLTLMGEGGEVARLPIRYGDDLTRLTLPEPPAREGCYGAWPQLPAFAQGDVVAEAVYETWVTLLPSREKEGVLALVLAGGEFCQSDVLRAVPSQVAPPVQDTVRVLDISLERTDTAPSGPLTLRVLSGGEEQVWLLTEDGWQKAEGTQNGSYFIFTAPSSQVTVAVSRLHTFPYKRVALLAAAVLVLVLLLILIIRGARKRKRARRALAEQELEEGQEPEAVPAEEGETLPEETGAGAGK